MLVRLIAAGLKDAIQFHEAGTAVGQVLLSEMRNPPTVYEAAVDSVAPGCPHSAPEGRICFSVPATALF